MSEPPVDTKPMGEDMPLAFASSAPADTAPTKAPEAYIEPVNAAAVVPPILTSPASDTPKLKKGGNKLKGLVVGLLIAVGLIGGVGLFGYQKYGSVQSLIAAVFIPKFTRVDGEVVRNPAWEALEGQEKTDNEEARNESLGGNNVEVQKGNKGTDPASCNGCLNGGWMVWRDGECKITGICGSNVPGKDTENPAIEAANDAASCSKSGGTWCAATDMANRSYAFCNGSANKTCQTAASEKGYAVLKGAVLCKASGNTWVADPSIDYYWDTPGLSLTPDQVTAKIDAEKAIVNAHCADQFKKVCPTPDAASCQVGFGSGDFICQVGKAGSGGDVYKAGQACTAANGYPFKGSLGCFCGVVQMDTPMGHTSYSSTCGCNEPEDNTPNPSTPTITTNPKLMCTGLTRTPTTTPAIGDKVTFTCVGASVPAGSVNLSYKFRYSLNSGAYTTLTNKTPTTSELMISACGTYSVECQACGTINGVLTCDPTWAGATTQ
jgi:hypothetical protein